MMQNSIRPLRGLSHSDIRGKSLTSPCMFGSDPLHNCPDLIRERTRRMNHVLPCIDTVFGQVVNDDFSTFLKAIKTMIEASSRSP